MKVFYSTTSESTHVVKVEIDCSSDDHLYLFAKILTATQVKPWQVEYTAKKCANCNAEFDNDYAVRCPCDCLHCIDCFEKIFRSPDFFIEDCPCLTPFWSRTLVPTVYMVTTDSGTDPICDPMITDLNSIVPRCGLCLRSIIEDPVDSNACCSIDKHRTCLECSNLLATLRVRIPKKICPNCSPLDRFRAAQSLMAIRFGKDFPLSKTCYVCKKGDFSGKTVRGCCSYHECHVSCYVSRAFHFAGFVSKDFQKKFREVWDRNRESREFECPICVFEEAYLSFLLYNNVLVF